MGRNGLKCVGMSYNLVEYLDRIGMDQNMLEKAAISWIDTGHLANWEPFKWVEITVERVGTV